MRNRILAGLGVAALASVGIATPATAVTPTTADLYIVHAFAPSTAVPDTTVDIFINDTLTLDNVDPGAVAGPAGSGTTFATVAGLGNLPPATYQVRIELVNPPSGVTNPLFDAPVPLAAGISYTAVAHPEFDSGAFTVSLFENDLTPSAAGNGLVTVRHTANVGDVSLFSVANPLGATISNDGSGTGGDQEAVLDVPAGTVSDVNAGADATARSILLGDVAVVAGTNLFVQAYGPLQAQPPFGAVIFSIGGLTTPTDVPAGSAGLVAEDAPVNGVAIGGAIALLLALMAGVAVIARRRSVSAEL